MIAPDSIEPYLGWKALRVNSDGTLYSPQVRSKWPVGKRLEAECQMGDAYVFKWIEIPEDEVDLLSKEMPNFVFGTMPPLPPKSPREGYTWFPQAIEVEHDVVEKTCSCGIYAVKEIANCWPYISPDTVLAQVAIWGRTRTATYGVRGQYAYPQKLVAPQRLAAHATAAGELYGVPVEIDDSKFVIPNVTAPSTEMRQPSLVPLTLALLVSSFVAALSLFGQGSLMASILSSLCVLTAIIYTKFG